MRIAVIGGAGGMGRVTTADAATSEGVERVILVDRDAARAARGRLGLRERRGARAGRGPARPARCALRRRRGRQRRHAPPQRPRDAGVPRGRRPTTPISAASTTTRSSSTSSTMRSGGPGLSAAISMGAAPGITNMLAAAAVAELDTVESIEVLDACVAGRPYDPDEPYVPAYAADTLIDEFTRPAPMFIDGREQLMAAGGGARTYHLPEGDVECVYTIHSEPATLPRSYADRGIRNVEWRLGLPPSHTLPLRALVASGHGLDGSGARRRPGGDPARGAGRRARPPGRRAGGSGTRSSACAPTSSGCAAASGSRSTPTCRSRSAPSGEPTRARTPRACRPRSRRSCWRAARRCAPASEGPEVIVPVGPFFAALATRGMHAEIAVQPPARVTNPPRARPVSWERGRSGRVAEGGALLRRYRGLTSVEGSNPSFSVRGRANRCVLHFHTFAAGRPLA